MRTIKYKEEVYLINLADYVNIGNHWVVIYANKNEVIYFDSLPVEHIPNKIYWEGKSKVKYIKNSRIWNGMGSFVSISSILCWIIKA